MDELTLYDTTRDELRRRLSGRFPADFDLENTLTAYDYGRDCQGFGPWRAAALHRAALG